MSASTPVRPAPNQAKADDDLVADVMNGATEPTRRLLTVAAGDDPHLLCGLIRSGLRTGQLTRHDGQWQWDRPGSWSGRLTDILSDRVLVLSDEQLVALRALTEPWARPHAQVAAALDHRAGPGTTTGCIALTRREQQVLVLLGEGLTAQAIAHRLRLSPRTIAKHQERIYRKFGTSDRLTTVLRAQRLGLVRQVRADR